MQVPYGTCNWNEHGVNSLVRINWRTSLVPAPAVIPAPIAYIKVVAVKTLVVGIRGCFSFGLLGTVCTELNSPYFANGACLALTG